MAQSTKIPHLMRVVVKPGSKAEAKHQPKRREAVRKPSPELLAPGFQPTPEKDLKFRGGYTIPNLSYVNFYVGGPASWSQSDVDSINTALAAAMSDPGLNNVMRQYFSNQEITTTFLASHFVGSRRPRKVTQTSTEQLIGSLFSGGALGGLDFRTTVVNILLPRGTVLTDEGSGQAEAEGEQPGTPESEEASSLAGLGGYHGSVDIGANRVYYAVGVYSERLPDGRENGIAVFDQPWKNVVATFYHELNEVRTDPDVEVAIRTNTVGGVIGWNSDDGEECGDFPVFEAGDAGNLGLVFQEVQVAGGRIVPVQFQYSDAVHGPEGPIAAPHALLIAHDFGEGGVHA
jgi:hypothetical protein